MALADYFDRGAQAVSQIVAGFDHEMFAKQVGSLEVGLSFGADATVGSEGRAALDLAVRLLARFYPAITLTSSENTHVEDLARLAQSINPQIAISREARPRTGLVFGPDASPFDRSIYVGSDGWTGRAGTSSPLAFGASMDPFGAGIGACLGAGLLFREVVLGQTIGAESASLSAERSHPSRRILSRPATGLDALLVGGGAIGNAAVWALARIADEGELTIVDHEAIELSNLQRYVMSDRASVGSPKAPVLAAAVGPGLHGVPFVGAWSEFASKNGVTHPRVLLAMDSASDRRAVQASLPRWIANAWTQPGDLGVSEHSEFGGAGACVACLYHPDGPSPNEDEVVARALGIPGRQADVRTLLHLNAGLESEFLAAVAEGLHRPVDLLAPFAGRSIRELYVEGICGGAVLPPGSSGQVRAELHVPLAHQSALAGVLLAARLVQAGRTRSVLELTDVTSLDVLRGIPPLPTRSVRARTGCFCRDKDYTAIYRTKWQK